jgi:predicted unusual protein kinase regulating ubiquinone biosynthesis (AarF/ABC1/UbiB family)/nucleotide-binding universal stress UspA family protein
VVQRIVVATDRADAGPAVEWASEMAQRCAAELLLLRVVAPEHVIGDGSKADLAEEELTSLASRLAGERGKARVEYSSEPAQTIVEVVAEERADLVVLDDVGMRGRTEFLLGSVCNQVSHNAPCSVVIVNGGAEAERPDASGERVVSADAEPGAGELLGRAAQIAGVLAKYGLGGIIQRDGAGADSGGDSKTSGAARARRFRKALEELGPTFAKLGQILSTRPDLLPPALRDELAGLQDQVTPLTEAEVVAVMERELRVPWEDVFLSIEPQPMAAGTIAQVHRAVLVGGKRVVVKVQRPDAGEKILKDLGLLEDFARRAARRAAFQQVVDIPAIVDHLSSSLRRELDFRHEAHNIGRMQAVLAPFEHLGVPVVHEELSTARLLVMEEVQGIPVQQAPEGEARRLAGRQMLEAYYQQVLGDGFFHADPHPGNLMWWNDKVYMLDLGMVGEVDEELRGSLLLMLLAFWQEDSSFLADVLLSICAERKSSFDQRAYRAELADLVARYRHLSLQELRLGPLLQQLTEISVRNGVQLPASLALIGKAFGQMQLAAAELDPTLDPFSVAGTFYMRQLVGRLRSLPPPRQLFYETQKLRVRAERLIENLEKLAAESGQDSMDQTLHDAVTHAGRRVAVGLTAATAMIASAVTAGNPKAARWTAPSFGAAAAVLTGALAVDLFRRR